MVPRMQMAKEQQISLVEKFLQEQAETGISLRKFARKESVHSSTFSHWVRTYKSESVTEDTFVRVVKSERSVDEISINYYGAIISVPATDLEHVLGAIKRASYL